MKPSIQTLGDILFSRSQYVIPVFQRNYRWERPQWDKLWDAIRDFQEPSKQGNHFMGFLVFVPGLPQPGQNTMFHMIDGQQRLTTLSLVLAAIRNVARDAGLSELAEEIHQDYLVHPRKSGEEHYRLLPKERDHNSYIAAITGGSGVTGRIAEAIGYFEDRLGDVERDEPAPLTALFHTVLQRLEFMCATLEAENAYNIFKSLNSTGVPLGPADLIRNFMFMHVRPEDHDRFDNEQWTPIEERFLRADRTLDDARFSQFFRDYLMAASGRYFGPKDTFSAFESRFEATGFNPSDLGATLETFAQFYDVIVGSKPDVSEVVTAALEGLNALESSTTYPLLLTLFEQRARGSITSERLAEAVQMLRGFILRRFVCGESSRGYGQMFVRAVAREAGDCVAALERYLVQRVWPDDRRFESAFVEFPLYERDYGREILEALERSRGHREQADLSAAQLEHIMPQTLNDAWRAALGSDAQRIQEDWLHRPGNLTLSAYNAELWNHEFSRKRERYAQSNIVLTRELSAKQTWGAKDIRDRGAMLAGEAARLWRGPSAEALLPGPSTDGEDTPERFELRRRFWTGLADRMALDYPDLPQPESRPATEIRYPSEVRHIGIRLEFNLRRSFAAIHVWFWREASFPRWEALQAKPEELNRLTGGIWSFERVNGDARGRMSLERRLTDLRDEQSWPAAHEWMSNALSVLTRDVAPRLLQAHEAPASPT